MAINPKVFISYAWEDGITEWVKNLAQELRSDGVDAIIDQWSVVPGDRLPQFMEKSISSSDNVLIICTPKYKRKVDCRVGGAGYEGDIISSEQFYKDTPRKFIPLLKKGNWQDAAPTFLLSRNYLDFRFDGSSKESYQHLLRAIYKSFPTPPPLGHAPKFISDNLENKIKKN